MIPKTPSEKTTKDAFLYLNALLKGALRSTGVKNVKDP